MTRIGIQRRLGFFVFGLMMALGLLIPQAASAHSGPGNPAVNPAVLPDLPYKAVCTTGGGQIAGLSVEWLADQQGNPVLRFEFYTQKNAKATVAYRKHNTNGPWAQAYIHATPEYTTDHIFYTYALTASTEYDFTLTTYQCGNVVDTDMEQYWA
jgi:hypothetical protein